MTIDSGVIIQVITWVFSLVGLYIKIVLDNAKLSGPIGTLEEQMKVFWKDVSYDAARILHKPHPEARPMDELLELWNQGEISVPQIVELKQKLVEKIQDKNLDTGERSAASLMLRAIERIHQTKTGGLA